MWVTIVACVYAQAGMTPTSRRQSRELGATWRESVRQPLFLCEVELIGSLQGRMSVVITVLDREKVVQVSDTRVTSFADKSVMSETTRKTLVVLGVKARFVVGWVGFAVDATKRHETGLWVYEALRNMDVVELPIEEIANRLASAATTDLAPLQAANKCLGIVMAGWDSEPFVVTVSNYLEVKNKRTPDNSVKTHHIPSVTEAKCSLTFSGNIQRYAKKTKRDYLVSVMGDLSSAKLKRHFTGLRKQLKNNAAACDITDVCRKIALEASTHTHTIGRTLIGVELLRTEKYHCTYYSENGKPELLIPPTFTLQGSYRDAKITDMPDGTQRLQGEVTRRIKLPSVS
jgi:hypothetical protein